jgi:hypothetical protein
MKLTVRLETLLGAGAVEIWFIPPIFRGMKAAAMGKAEKLQLFFNGGQRYSFGDLSQNKLLDVPQHTAETTKIQGWFLAFFFLDPSCFRSMKEKFSRRVSRRFWREKTCPGEVRQTGGPSKKKICRLKEPKSP